MNGDKNIKKECDFSKAIRNPFFDKDLKKRISKNLDKKLLDEIDKNLLKEEYRKALKSGEKPIKVDISKL